MPDLGEPVLGGLLLGPRLDRRAGHLDRPATRTADQVVVVLAPTAPAVELLAVRQSHLVDLTGIGEQLQSAIYGRQSDSGADRPQLRVQLLSAAELIGTVEQSQYLSALAGIARHSGRRTGHRDLLLIISDLPVYGGHIVTQGLRRRETLDT